MKKEITIVIPALNEEESLHKLLTKFRKFKKLYSKVIIIDGNSSDKTVEVAKKNSCKVIIQKERYNGIPKVRSFYDGLKILLAMIKLFFRKW